MTDDLHFEYGEITVSELIEWLKTMPQAAKVFYEDGNFGGPDRELRRADVKKHSDDVVLFNSPYWSAVD